MKELKKAIELWSKNQYKEAYQILEAILSEDPNHIETLELLGHILDEEALNKPLNQDLLFEKAKLCYERILDLNPNQIQANIDLADYYKRNKEFNKALQFYNKSIVLICSKINLDESLKDDLKDVYREMIFLLEEMGDVVQLKSCLEKALELFPESNFFTSIQLKYV